MILVALVVVLAVVALVVVVVAIMGGGVDDGFATVGVVLAIVVIVVVALVGAGFVAGDGGGEREGDGTPSAPVVVSGGVAPPLRPAQLVLMATSEGQLPRPLGAVGDIVDGEVLVVGVAGLEPGSRATVHQCPTGASAPSSCRAGLAFHVGPHGSASVLVDLEEVLEVAGGDHIDCARDDCSVVVFGTARLEAQTVFGEPAPPPVTLIADPVAVPPGGTLTVTADQLPSGSEAAFAVCRPDGTASVDCGAPTPGVSADRDGRASASLTVGAGRCPRGSTCAVAVVVDGGEPRAYAPLRIIGRSGVAYDDPRLRAGLVVAALLLGIALVLLRRTDWTPVGGDPFAGVEIPRDPFADVPDP